MHAVAGQIFVGMGDKFTVCSGHGPAADFLDQRFGAAAVFNQVSNGANLQAVLCCKRHQIGKTRHGAIVFHDFANHRCRRAVGHRRQVATCFGMACTHEHTAIHRLQREDMAGLYQVAGRGVWGYGHLHRASAVGCRNARGHALRGFNGDGESGAVNGAISLDHGRQFQVFAALAGEGQANQATPKAGHEIDGLSCDMVGRQHQVAFVLAVFFIDQNHHAARFHVGHDVGQRRNGNRLEGACHGFAFNEVSRLSMRST